MCPKFKQIFKPTSILTLIVLGFILHPCTAQTILHKPISIIPQPVSVLANNQIFRLNKRTGIYLGNNININNTCFFKKYIKQLSGITIRTITNENKDLNVISLKLDSISVPQKEGYHLMVRRNSINITGHDEAGVFYGLQSLIQLMERADKGIKIRGFDITDYPRFNYRGMSLDVSRHFFPVSAIKKWINFLALYKINTFHWHLTDDQGWRIEIKKYPRLQQIGAYRNETLIGHKKELPHCFDGKKYGGYYTQEEAKEIVQYAAKRHINVIPEIEMPGHALAALASYPNLGCTGGPYHTATYWGIFNDVYCAGNEETFNFLEDVLDEVIKIFPSPYVHIGGDECLKDRWKLCPKCQKRIADEHLKDEHGLQSYFITRISKYLATKNKHIIGWDEILEGGLTPDATIMSWTGEKGGIESAKQAHQVIMTPEKWVYLDSYQSLYATDSLAAGGYIPLRKIYSYEPVPVELTRDQAQFIKGVQANVWSEYMPNINKAEYMIFPRILALAEISWSPKKSRNFRSFLSRIRTNGSLLKSIGINAANNYDQITDTLTTGNNNLPLLHLRTSMENASIRYTVNGSLPNFKSKKYHSALLVKKSCLVKAALFVGKTRYQSIYSKRFLINKATGKKVTLLYQPSGSYNPGDTWCLVNGACGSNRYNDGQWFGFNEDQTLAVIDLGKLQQITGVGTDILNYHWQKMWPPVKLVFSISADGINYQQVYQQADFPVNGINKVRSKILPEIARYIKVQTINRDVIPTGEYGAGGKPWLLLDQFIIN